MSAYCEPIRIYDWNQKQPRDSWSDSVEAQTYIERSLVQALAITLAEVRASAHPIPAESSLEKRFEEQAERWKRETAHLSSPNQLMMHPSYQAILGMGERVVPLLLRDLRDNRRPWFSALSYLTTENPIKPADSGKMDKMIAAWTAWGKTKGLL